MMGLSKLLILSTLIIISSCSFFSSNESSTYTKSQFVNNTVINGYKNWKVVKNEGADFALLNSVTNNIFLFNSACRKFEASNLSTLTSSLLTGIESIVISKKEIIQLFDREALAIVANGKVDGVKTYFSIITLQKNSCIYDYALISSKEKKLEKDLEEFNLLIKKVIIKDE